MWGRLAVGVLSLAVGAAAAWVLLDPGNGATSPERPVRQDEPPIVDSTTARTDVRASFASIAALPSDFERNNALYGLLADADATHVERLLAEAENLPPADHRYDISRVLYIRFAAIDPAAAVDHVVAANYHPSWVAAVFRVWAHRDLEAAAARAVTLGDAPKALATRAILDLDLPAEQREVLANQLDDGTGWGTISALGMISAREAARGGQRDFAAEGENAIRSTDATARWWRVRQVVRAWVRADPASALAWVEGVTDQQLAWAAQTAFTQTLVAKDPVAALDVLARTDGIWSSATVDILMRGLVKVGVADAIASLDVVPTFVQRRARIALLNAVRSHRAGDLDFESVLDWYSTLAQPIRAKLAVGMAGTYAAHDPESAFAWAMALEDEQAKGGAIRGVMGQLGGTDRATGMRLLARIEDPAVHSRALSRFFDAYRYDDPREAWRWARSVRWEEHRPNLLQSAFHTWASADPEEATSGLLALPVQLRDKTAAQIRWQTMLGTVGHARVERIFDAIEWEGARQRMANGLARYYTDTDPNEERAAFYRGIAEETDDDYVIFD